jgi:hypothetical protein
MTAFRLIIVCLSAVLFFSPVLLQAQEKVGTALVDGKKIELYSDRTWNYADRTVAKDAGCAPVRSGVEFCGSELGWKLTKSDDPDISAQYRLDDKNYGLFIVEDVGTADGLNLEFMRTAAISNFADAAGISEVNVTVFGVEAASVDGFSGETVLYGGKFNGLNIVFSNTIVIQENRSVQTATYTVGETPTEKSKALHQEFVAKTKLK